VGAIVEYVVDPSLIPPKIIPGKEISDLQSFIVGLCLISLTGRKQPKLINDWTHLHEYLQFSKDTSLQSKYKLVLDVLAAFQQELKTLSKVIDDRNKVRQLSKLKQKFNSFIPRLLECSVSV
jgi:hypothetical protein